MRGSSRASLAQAESRLEPVFRIVDSLGLGTELFNIASVINGNTALRRSLTDPSREGSVKANVVREVLLGKVTPAASEAVEGLAASRWTEPGDFIEALESIGVDAVLASAERNGQLETVAEELFRAERSLDQDADLDRALTDSTVPLERRLSVVDRLFGTKIRPESLALVKQAVSAPSGRRIGPDLSRFSERAMKRRERGIARVETAVPLSPTQADRLARALERVYGRSIHINSDVNPELVGGMRIQVGDEIIDSSITSRLNEARRRFTD